MADALAQVGHRTSGGRGRVVELMGQARGDGAQRQQLLPLTDDLGLPAPTDEVAFQQMDRHGELSPHEGCEIVRVEYEAARRLGQPYRGLVRLLLTRDIGRPRTEVHATLRGAVGLD